MSKNSVGQFLSEVKNGQILKDSFENIVVTSESKPNLFEIDKGKEFHNKIFQNFLNYNNIKHYSRNTTIGADFAERFIESRRNLFKKPVFEKRDVSKIDVLPTKAKQYKN